MKKLMMIAVLTMTSASAMAMFQAPIHQSGTVYKALITALYDNPKLQDGYIRKIEVTYETATAELVDTEGKCSVVSYTYWVNEQWQPVFEANPLAPAKCK
ncbi:hypothetical protein D3C87_1772950 [compost metagenome]